MCFVAYVCRTNTPVKCCHEFHKHPVFVVCSDVFKLNLGAFDRPNLRSSKRVISLNKCRTKERRVSDIKGEQGYW